MFNSKYKKLTILTTLLISIIILGLFHKLNYSYAQDGQDSLKINKNYELIEYSEITGITENITSINIDLGASRFNITDIELNFTDIKLEREITSIVDEETASEIIYHKNGPFRMLNLGVQFKLNSPTKLYGVYLFGYKRSGTSVPIKVQIRGYNNANNNPNQTIYLSQEYNVSTSRNWYYQNFSSPLSLPSGNYYIVLNGSSLPATDADYYFWMKNDIDPTSLYKSRNKDNTIWDPGVTNSPFLYKLDQKFNKIYYPEEINMTAEINGIPQKIINGTVQGDGNLKLDGINFDPETDNLIIPINTNGTRILNFTLNYKINLKNSFLTEGNLEIFQDFNEWAFSPTLDKNIGNYSVYFSYPKSWVNLTVNRDIGGGFENITDQIEKGDLPNGEHYFLIKNDTIEDNYDWIIIANSPNIGIILNGIEADYDAGGEFLCGVNNPLQGNYTFFLFYSTFERYSNITSYSGPGNVEFNYLIPTSGPNGEWEAIVYWNNDTDASVQSQTFTVSGATMIISGDNGGGGGGGTTVTGLDPLLVYTIVLITIIGAVGGLTSYQAAKRIKKKRDLELQKLHSKFIDILSLNYLLVVDKKTGLNVYEQFFAGKAIDASLISGFLEAIRNFGIELTGTYSQSQTVKLEYQESKILMSEFKDFRLIFVMTEVPSEDFINSITKLSYDINQSFGELIQNFKGDTTPFRAISQFVEKNFNVSFIAPLTIRDVGDIKLKDAEIAMINKAKSIMKQNNLNFFFTSFLLPEQTYDPKKTRIVFNLIEKKVFVPTKLT